MKGRDLAVAVAGIALGAVFVANQYGAQIAWALRDKEAHVTFTADERCPDGRTLVVAKNDNPHAMLSATLALSLKQTDWAEELIASPSVYDWNLRVPANGKAAQCIPVMQAKKGGGQGPTELHVTVGYATFQE